jgi:asparagine synthase (glutamine-hydrolysing)
MFYGELSLNSLAGKSKDIYRLQKVLESNGCIHHQVEYGGLSGGFFLHSRFPYTMEDSLYINTNLELLVLMSGSIYNRQAIEQELNLESEVWSVPGLIAQAFLGWGADFVNKLNGDFSIAIYQAFDKKLFLFRDHVGINPLAYTARENSIFFSFDIIGLCRVFHEGERINMDPVISIYKPVDMTLTPNPKVFKLKAGHFLQFNADGVKIQKYWHPERIKTDNNLSQPQMLAEIKALLHDAVHIRSDQRFNAGAHLSGGFDSSTVAVLARKEYPNQAQFYGYSWSPDNSVLENNELDERELVKQTCQMAGIEPSFVHMEVNDCVDLVKNSLRSFMYFYEEKVLELAKQHRTNLLFSGWGGDEFISFGSLGVDSDLFFNFQWKTFLKKNPLRNPKKIISYLLYRILFPAINFIPFRVRKSFEEELRFFKKEYTNFHQKTYKLYYCYRSRREYQLGLLKTHHIPERTECWAVTGFRNGVVYRYPLLDKRIIEYMLKVPSKALVKDSKYTRIILREITEGLLPEEVRWRIGKADPAFFSLVKKQSKERGLLFINEVEEFKKNPNLYFVDFNLLEEEIKKFRENPRYPDVSKLCGDIVAFKMFHEFTKSYQEKIEDSVLAS